MPSPQLAQQSSQTPEFYNNLGIALLKSNSSDDAIRALNESLALNNSFTFAYNNRGIALLSEGKYDAAIRDFKNATKIDPNYAEAWYNNGTALCRLKRSSEANASFDKASSLRYSISGSCHS